MYPKLKLYNSNGEDWLQLWTWENGISANIRESGCNNVNCLDWILRRTVVLIVMILGFRRNRSLYFKMYTCVLLYRGITELMSLYSRIATYFNIHPYVSAVMVTEDDIWHWLQGNFEKNIMMCISIAKQRLGKEASITDCFLWGLRRDRYAVVR